MLLAPVLLPSRKYVHFLPAPWWQDSAFTPSLILAILLPAVWLIRGLGEADRPSRSPSGLPDNALVFRILPAFAVFGLIFITCYITLPGVAALVLGGPTTQQVTAQMNFVGSVDAPSRGYRYKAVIADRMDSLYGRLCFASREDKTAARSMGKKAIVDLHGWGYSFGIYYTATTPVGPAGPEPYIPWSSGSSTGPPPSFQSFRPPRLYTV